MASYPLENEFIRVEIDNDFHTISIIEKKLDGIEIKSAYLDMKYTQKGRRFSGRKIWRTGTVSGIEEIETVHGKGQRRFLTIPNDENSVHSLIEFVLLDNAPKLLWRMKTFNNGSEPIHMERMEMFRAGYMVVTSSVKNARKTETGSVQLHPDASSLVFYSNGWQSWSYTGTYDYFQKFKTTKIKSFQGMMNTNHGSPTPKKIASFASEMFGVYADLRYKNGFVLGFLSQKKHFGTLEALTHAKYPAIRMWANGDHTRIDSGKIMETDWAYFMPIDLNDIDPLGDYFEDVAVENGIAGRFKDTEIPQGWCSWYEYFEHISEKIILDNLETAEEIKDSFPLDLIQIDDGYQMKVGDWLETRETFPNGMKPIVDKIKEKGFTPGIWLAPFAISKESSVFQNHPDWLLYNVGQPVKAGWLPQWGKGQSTALDLTNPEAMEYVHHFIKTVVEDWGFDYLKLDFLYAAAVACQYQDSTKTRAEVLRAGLETIRDAAGSQTRILGCGCPLGPAIGLVDAMRVSADVDAFWKPEFNGIKFIISEEPGMPSASLAIHNTITRAGMHRRWWLNDPDCLLLRPSGKLTMDEIHSLTTTIGMSGGSMLLSDDMPNLPEERFRLAQILMPLMGERPYVPDLLENLNPNKMRLDLKGTIGEWHLISYLNWEDKAKDVRLNLKDYGLDARQEYFAHEFWSGEYYDISNGIIDVNGLVAHGTALFALYEKTNQPQYLGSNFHLSQGQEVKAWKVTKNRVAFTIGTVGKIAGHFDLKLMSEPKSAVQDGTLIEWQSLGNDICRFAIEVDKKAIIEIKQ